MADGRFAPTVAASASSLLNVLAFSPRQPSDDASRERVGTPAKAFVRCQKRLGTAC